MVHALDEVQDLARPVPHESGLELPDNAHATTRGVLGHQSPRLYEPVRRVRRRYVVRPRWCDGGIHAHCRHLTVSSEVDGCLRTFRKLTANVGFARGWRDVIEGRIVSARCHAQIAEPLYQSTAICTGRVVRGREVGIAPV